MNIAVILAGGKGSRMKSNTCKVLQEVCGKPIISYLVESLKNKNIAIYIVLGQYSMAVKDIVGADANYIYQSQPLGTGHAVGCACEFLKGVGNFEKILVVNGDGPIFETSLIDEMFSDNFDLKILTKYTKKFLNYGRIIRQNNSICDIVEQKDCTKSQLKIREYNLGMYCFDFTKLCGLVTKISRNNAQNEYYVTDLVKLFYDNNFTIKGVDTANFQVFNGANTLEELVCLDKKLRVYKNKKLLFSGVKIIDIFNTYIDYDCDINKGTTIHPNVTIKGKSKIGANVKILPNCYIENCVIKDNIFIGANSVLVNMYIDKDIEYSTMQNKKYK